MRESFTWARARVCIKHSADFFAFAITCMIARARRKRACVRANCVWRRVGLGLRNFLKNFSMLNEIGLYFV